MKRGFYILLIMCTAIMVVSCDKTKSYTDMLKAQENFMAHWSMLLPYLKKAWRNLILIKQKI